MTKRWVDYEDGVGAEPRRKSYAPPPDPNQTDLLGNRATDALARLSDPQTSVHAAHRAGLPLRASQVAVLHLLRQVGAVTDEELVAAYSTAMRAHPVAWPPQSPSGIRSRRAELVRSGDVVANGWRQSRQTGNRMTVWRATDRSPDVGR